MSPEKAQQLWLETCTPEEYIREQHNGVVFHLDEDDGGGTDIIGVFCGYHAFPMSTRACEKLCDEYDSCDEVCRLNDMVKMLDNEGGGWCCLCGEFMEDGGICSTHGTSRFRMFGGDADTGGEVMPF